jgi:hypothetical protein
MPNPPARHRNGRFGPGNPGRPLGSRNRVSRRLVLAILEDFEAHQEDVYECLRRQFMPVYARLVWGLLPKSADYALPDFSDFSELQKARRVNEVRDALDRVQFGEGTLLDLEAVLLNEEPYRR